MKRLIATTLTVALFTGLYAGKASAQDVSGSIGDKIAMVNTAESALDEIGGMLHHSEPVVDPSDCPDIMDLWFELLDCGFTEDEAFDLIEMDLWFELLDCGFTEDEAFDLIEMVLDEGPKLFDPEDIVLRPFIINVNVPSTF